LLEERSMGSESLLALGLSASAQFPPGMVAQIDESLRRLLELRR